MRLIAEAREKEEQEVGWVGEGRRDGKNRGRSQFAFRNPAAPHSSKMQPQFRNARRSSKSENPKITAGDGEATMTLISLHFQREPEECYPTIEVILARLPTCFIFLSFFLLSPTLSLSSVKNFFPAMEGKKVRDSRETESVRAESSKASLGLPANFG